MEKFFTFESKTVNGQTTCAAYERADEQAALSAYHSGIASALVTDGCTECVFMVFTSDGRMLEHPFSWRKPE